MKIVEAARPSIVLNYDDSLRHAVGQMILRKRPDAIVVKQGGYEGMVFSNALLKRSMVNPDRIKIGKLAVKVPLFAAEADIEYCINSMIVNDYKAIPICHRDDFMEADAISILNALKGHRMFKGKKASDVMKPPITIEYDRPAASAIKILLGRNISRLVVTRGDKIEGLLESLHLLSADISKERPKELLVEKERIRSFAITSMFERNAAIVDMDESIPNVIEMIGRKAAGSVIVSDDGRRPIGIITPKALLSLLVEKPGGIKISVSGLEEESETRDIIGRYAVSYSRKLEKISKLDYISVHVERHHKEGGGTKYSLKGRLSCGLGFFHSSVYSWNAQDAVSRFFEVLEKEIMKKRGRKADMSKAEGFRRRHRA
ncbi:MAG: CBS domain-containing protein [Candidatus Aenigmarchaeota archaeon]|nr:CBS domain-containing protein [Candidatus Aenigmarchaeota archaeon]